MTPDATTPPALATRALGYRVGGSIILEDIDLEVPTGAFLGIIGPNGAGKSTLLNMLSGVGRPTSGTVELDGVDVTRLGAARRARRGLGRTFQTSTLFESLSAHENVRLAAQVRRGGTANFWRAPRRSDPASRVADEALDRVGLAAQSNTLTAVLSHGEKRKLELAILLASDARTLLLDEPMAGVNTEDVPVLRDLIGELHGEGRTVVMVEHHLAVVIGLAQYLAVLDSGRLLAVGAPQEVIANDEVQQAYLGQPL